MAPGGCRCLRIPPRDDRDHPFAQPGNPRLALRRLLAHQLRHGLMIPGENHFITGPQAVEQFRHRHLDLFHGDRTVIRPDGADHARGPACAKGAATSDAGGRGSVRRSTTRLPGSGLPPGVDRWAKPSHQRRPSALTAKPSLLEALTKRHGSGPSPRVDLSVSQSTTKPQSYP